MPCAARTCPTGSTVEISPDLAEIGGRLVRAFDVRERPFHFEFFRLPDGSLAALEVNMRQPGGLTVDMWNWANDIDFYRAWAEVVVGGTTEVRTRAPTTASGPAASAAARTACRTTKCSAGSRACSSTTNASMMSLLRRSATMAT